MENYTIKKIIDLYGLSISRNTLQKAEAQGIIPPSTRSDVGAVKHRTWPRKDIPKIGGRYGFLKRFDRPVAMPIFTTKGGVLKTTLALNIARMAALHDIKTCVVGLDMQGDISRALGLHSDLEEAETLEAAMDAISSVQGLYDVHTGAASLKKVILPTDLPTLFFIPETPELVHLAERISIGTRREYWLKDNIIDPLKKEFDLIILDCSPNWNHLVTNALVASDVLISPLECRVNNYRNCIVFRLFLKLFLEGMKLNFPTIFVPTRLNSQKKLSAGIHAWYIKNIPDCTFNTIRETNVSEDSMYMNVSLPEHMPKSLFAQEMRALLLEIWSRINDSLKQPSKAPTV